MTVVLGVDGSRGRWVAARLDGADVRWVVLATAREAVEAATDASAVCIDVPIGVTDTRRHRGPGTAGPLGLVGLRYPDATGVRVRPRRARPAVVSRQPPTASAGDLGIVDRVVEVHPECSFRAMDRLTGVEADGTTGAGTRNWPGKKSAAGAAARLSLLGPALGTDP